MTAQRAIQFLGEWLEKRWPCSDCSPNDQSCRCLALADARRILDGERPVGKYLPDWNPPDALLAVPKEGG